MRHSQQLRAEMASQKELAFLALGAGCFQALRKSGNESRIRSAGVLGTDGNAAHTADAGICIDVSGIFLVDGTRGALTGAEAAAGTFLVGNGNHGGSAAWFVGAVAGNCDCRCRGRVCFAFQFYPDFRSEIEKFGIIIGIRASGSVLVHDGMLGDGADSGADLKTGLLGQILKFDQSVLVGTVSINTDKDASGAVSANGGKAAGSQPGNPPGKGRNGDYDGIFIRKLDGRKVRVPVHQINGITWRSNRLTQAVRNFFCAAGGAE